MLVTARRLSKVLQLTLAVIKPDAVAHPLMLEVKWFMRFPTLCFTAFKSKIGFTKGCIHRVGMIRSLPECVIWNTHIAINRSLNFFVTHSQALHQRILDNSFVIVRCKDLVWRKQDSERFYAEHSGVFSLSLCFLVDVRKSVHLKKSPNFMLASQGASSTRGLWNSCRGERLLLGILSQQKFLCLSQLPSASLGSLMIVVTLLLSQWTNASVHFSPRRCDTSLERADGADQGVPSSPHLSHLHKSSVWTHRHKKHDTWLR